jgi:ATP-dependent DNA helicase RecQ
MAVKDIPDFLKDAVNKLFGFSYLFPYQRLVITNILEAAQAAGIPVHWPDHESGNANEEDDAGTEESDHECYGRQIVILPTSTGKSLCFQLPAMLINGVTLVIYPLLSLMADQERHLREYGFSPVVLRGGQSSEDREAIWEKLKSGQSKIIIANPEVLLTRQVKTRLDKIKIVHIVIDEAHCVSEWGESFRPSYLEINSIITHIKPPLITAFTATASAPVLEKIKKYIFNNMEARQVIGNPDRPNIYFSAKGCIIRNLAVRDLIIENARPAIIFCSSRPGTEKLARYLRNEFAGLGFAWHREIRFYHAGLSREEKTVIEKWFLHNSEAVLTATCAYGMGVDKADVRTIIHRDVPPSVEAYLQEAGRAGRDGKQSRAFLLWRPDDEMTLFRARSEAARARVQALLRYTMDANHCRRHALLALLDYNANGEVPGKLCCDVCENVANPDLREKASLLQFFHKNKRRFTPEQAASVLAEGNTVRWSKEEAAQALGYLIETGELVQHKRFPWKNKLTVAN